MNHPSEEDLVLNYYAEGNNRSEIERHLGACEACRALYDSVEITLKRMDALAVPEPVSDFEARVWQRLLPELPLPKFPLLTPAWRWVAASAALAFMLGLAFLAGRHYPEPAKRIPAVGNPESRESLLEVAVGDHLERSQMVLTELANTSSSGPLDISFEQARAADLLGENRLYRQTALGAGDALLAGVLDELERVLLEIAHAPSQISPAELDELRLRLQAEGLLFKLRVLGANVRNQEQPRNPL